MKLSFSKWFITTTIHKQILFSNISKMPSLVKALGFNGEVSSVNTMLDGTMCPG
jgi:hypothetical protein